MEAPVIHHPVLNLITIFISIVIAESVPQLEIPIIYMQLIQIAAWGTGIIVGAITILKFLRGK